MEKEGICGHGVNFSEKAATNAADADVLRRQEVQ
jgi:hypothetical protein